MNPPIQYDFSPEEMNAYDAEFSKLWERDYDPELMHKLPAPTEETMTWFRDNFWQGFLTDKWLEHDGAPQSPSHAARVLAFLPDSQAHAE